MFSLPRRRAEVRTHLLEALYYDKFGRRSAHKQEGHCVGVRKRVTPGVRGNTR
jgi:hypothetical protein